MKRRWYEEHQMQEQINRQKFGFMKQQNKFIINDRSQNIKLNNR